MAGAGGAVRVGIDIGGTNTDAVILDDAGSVAHSVRLPSGRGPDAVVRIATDAVLGLADLARTSPTSFATVGVGVPGTVDTASGTVAHARNLDVASLDLGRRLGANLGVPVRVENDVNAAALGAFHLLGLGSDRSMAYLNLGTGLAAGLVLDGELWRGSRGAAGEIGHILIDPAGPVDEDGQSGALEVMASGSGIGSQWPGSVTDMLAAADRGEASAIAIRERMFGAVASAVRILVLTVDVDLVVIGGGISQLGNPLLGAVRSVFEQWEGGSPFLTSLRLGERVRILPPDSGVAATGAAWLGAVQWQR
jgi:predicted NBD/HSP70 family sugar kinase